MPILPNWFFITIISICTVVLLFLTTKFTDKRYRKQFLKRITKKGWAGIAVSVVMLVTLIWQDNNTTDRASHEKHLSDSLSDLKDTALAARDRNYNVDLKRSTDSTVDSLFAKIARAFDKQRLSFDTLNDVVTRKRDTVSMTVNPPVKDPYFVITDIFPSPRIEGKITLTYKFKSQGASSVNLNFAMYGLAETVDGKITAKVIESPFLPDQVVPADLPMEAHFFYQDKEELKTFYIYILGTYRDRFKKMPPYPINTVYSYNFVTKETFISNPEITKAVISIISSAIPIRK